MLSDLAAPPVVLAPGSSLLRRYDCRVGLRVVVQAYAQDAAAARQIAADWIGVPAAMVLAAPTCPAPMPEVA